jgi:hypothetical protein
MVLKSITYATDVKRSGIAVLGCILSATVGEYTKPHPHMTARVGL